MIKLVFKNDEAIKWTERLVNGEFDKTIENNKVYFGQVVNDKERVRKMMSDGLTVKEAYEKMMEENAIGFEGMADEDIVEGFNDSLEFIGNDEWKESAERLMKDQLDEDGYKLFMDCCMIMKTTELKIV